MTTQAVRSIYNLDPYALLSPIPEILQWRHLATSMVAVPLLAKLGYKWHEGMEQTMFTPGSYLKDGRLVAQLDYQTQSNGHALPVLQLHSEDEYEMGFSQGYLMGKEVNKIFHLVLKPMMVLAGAATGDFFGSFYNQQIQKITIPERFQREIQGLVAGVHQCAQEQGFETDVTEELFLNAHKLTDIYKSILCQRIFGIPCFNSMGCSTAVVKKGNEIGVCRTLDWPSMGLMGQYTFIRRHSVKGMQVEMQTFPGIIGALTASNDRGLVAIINEVGTTSKAGVPYNLLTRDIIDHATSVKKAKAMIDDPSYVAASSHHLTLADRTHAINFQMHVLPDKKYLARELHFDNENQFLVVTNHAVDLNGNIIEGSFADSSSSERYASMSKCLTNELQSDHKLPTIMKQALLAVNVMETVCAATFSIPEQGKAQPLQYVHDNYFAATHLK